MMVQLASGNTILQTITTEDKRGRVMGLYTMSVAGMVPFGTLFSGFVAKFIGASSTIFIGGLACACGAFAFYRALPGLREQVRPIYRDLGIIVEMSEGS
jgi:MFS family permease